MTETSIAPKIVARSAAERIDAAAPVLLVPVLGLIGFLCIGDASTWVTLTVAGLAMGMMIFIMASGMTVVFGLMDVINFGHGAFISLGAFTGFTALALVSVWAGGDSVILNLAAVLFGMIAAMLVTGGLGFVFERVIVRPVYGSHLKQILVTMGGLIVVQQLILVIWGPDALHLPRPPGLSGSFVFGEIAVERYRVGAVVLGLLLFAAMRLVLARTRIGLLVRAGVENGEMVEALGFRIRRLFLAVFMVGSAMAGLGGVMWALYQETVTAQMGSEVMILVFIVIIVGGLGSVEGCFLGALLVGLMANYVAFLAPKVALVSNIGLMVAVLLWRSEGFFSVVKAK